ncbi:MAG: hypothetical protein LBK50_02515, partial [Candidatus Nomurabacteria bacterium]|nr:hypothetical protein [Candidatus Nomurabacteria bacterium]
LGEEEGFNGLVGRAVAMGGGMRGNRRKKVITRRGGKEMRGTIYELVRVLGSLERRLEQRLVIVRCNEREREREREEFWFILMLGRKRVGRTLLFAMLLFVVFVVFITFVPFYVVGYGYIIHRFFGMSRVLCYNKRYDTWCGIERSDCGVGLCGGFYYFCGDGADDWVLFAGRFAAFHGWRAGGAGNY